jgi:hypothetical protein
MEPRFVGRPACELVTLMTELQGSVRKGGIEIVKWGVKSITVTMITIHDKQ